MYDQYIHEIAYRGAFLAGYTQCRLLRPSCTPFLYTTLRVVRVLRGSAKWKVGDKLLDIRERDIIVVNNVEIRQFIQVDGPFECEIFAFLPTVFQAGSDCLNLFYGRAASFDPVISHSVARLSEVHKLLDMLKQNFENQFSSYSCMLISGTVTCMTAMILDDLQRNHPEMLRHDNDSCICVAETVAQAVRYINENIASPFTISQLADYVNLSRGYFSKVFHQYTGQTPKSYVNQCRINHVIYLAKIHHNTILEAAMNSGFQSASGFYKTFHTICGIPPRELLSPLNEFTAV